MKKVEKIAYIDFDGTLCSHVQSNDCINFENLNKTGNTALKEVINLFGESYISKHSVNNLKKLKEIDVTLVGVTARDSISGTSIVPEVLNLFDRIYTNSSFSCYDVSQKKMCTEYNQRVKTFYENTINMNLSTLEGIYKKHGFELVVFPTNIQQALVYTPYINTAEFNAMLKEIKYYVDYVLFEAQNVIEFKLAPVSKADAIAYDLEQYEDTYTVCLGDSKTDYEMLSRCDLGIFPESLIKRVNKSSVFVNTGSNVSKVITIEDSYWFLQNLKEAIVAFSKIK